ncbi:hypothetical protein J2S43_005164 [Catenuloplanes nepalensis]|uniref:Uncharacterized protein n=1 Tax=Catenuloplanes nepalensis TaxID=587533 RepID=A0ABT9MYZ2_9ACTN|nr:hypothetical protein [Catenuloplanes nepalensis]
MPGHAAPRLTSRSRTAPRASRRVLRARALRWLCARFGWLGAHARNVGYSGMERVTPHVCAGRGYRAVLTVCRGTGPMRRPERRRRPPRGLPAGACGLGHAGSGKV